MAQARGIVPGLKPINSGRFYAGVTPPRLPPENEKFCRQQEKVRRQLEVAVRIPDCNEQAGQAN